MDRSSLVWAGVPHSSDGVVFQIRVGHGLQRFHIARLILERACDLERLASDARQLECFTAFDADRHSRAEDALKGEGRYGFAECFGFCSNALGASRGAGLRCGERRRAVEERRVFGLGAGGRAWRASRVSRHVRRRLCCRVGGMFLRASA